MSLPPVGKSDHNAIHLIPAYRLKIQTDPIVKKNVKVWTPGSEEQLRGCFECTEWSVLVDSCENVSEAADVVSSSLLFKGCGLDATAGLAVTTAGLGHSWTREPRHPVHVTDVHATKSRTQLVHQFKRGLLFSRTVAAL